MEFPLAVAVVVPGFDFRLHDQHEIGLLGSGIRFEFDFKADADGVLETFARQGKLHLRIDPAVARPRRELRFEAECALFLIISGHHVVAAGAI